MASLRRFLPLLFLLFIGSGCAALIYEIVWFQLLQLVIGSSAVSLGVLLGTFMGGMCAGSLALPRIISPRWHPLRVYAALEIGIGLIGIAVLFGMPYLAQAYVANAVGGWTGILVRGAVCAICLLPPTLLMGATLPAVSRWIETTPRGVSWLGFFYGGNTAGAVVGCLLAGFYLLRVHDMATATYVAAGINAAVATVGLGVSLLLTYWPQPPGEVLQISGAWTVYAVIALSGMSALGAEVVWTRLLSLLLGATVYAFSIILAVFLIGLGIGSALGAMLALQLENPRRALGLCQLLLGGAIAWTAWAVSHSLPYWPIDPSLISASPAVMFQVDLMRCFWAIFPATVLWGASFPVALAAAAQRGGDPARLVGGVYAANTLGAIIGALLFSLVLIPWIGTQQAQRVMIGVAALAAVLAFKGPWRLAGLACVPLVWTVSAVPWGLVAYGRYLATTPAGANMLYVGEGINSSVAVTEESDGVRNFHVAGKIEASTEPQDMRLQRMLGDLPALLHPSPRSVLIVGCGAGVTAGSFVVQPDIRRIVICEIEPLVPKVVSTYFGEQNYNVVHDPRVQIVYDDARHFVLTTREKFDIITSDPIHPWVKGAATLYTREYFEMCKRRLNPGGIVTQWVPLYQTTEPTVQIELATFFAAFPAGTVWGNTMNGGGYDVVLLGEDRPARIDVDQLQHRLERDDHQKVAASLNEVGLSTAVELLATYGGSATDLKAWLEGAPINHDRDLRLQYLAGWAVDTNESERIYSDVLSRSTYPTDLFVTSRPTRLMLDVAMLKARGRH